MGCGAAKTITFMLQETRFGEHFELQGDTKTHYGLFDCGPEAVSLSESFLILFSRL